MGFKMNFVNFTMFLICAAFCKDLKAGGAKEGTNILSSTYQPFPYKQSSLKLDRSEITLYRKDGRCGENFPTEEGISTECDPEAEGNERGPCCSNAAWCGNSKAHCDCEGCIDYRVQTNHKGTKKIQKTTASPFKQLADLLTVVSGNNLEDFSDKKYDSDSFQPTSSSPPPPSGQKQAILSPHSKLLFAHPVPVLALRQKEGTGA